MIAQHPTESASDGRRIDQSHYIQHADRLDDMIQCAQCGWIIDLTKRSTGDSLGAIPEGSAIPNGGSTFWAPSPPLAVGTLVSEAKLESAGNGFPHGGVVGSPEIDYFADPVDTGSGCPFCNTLNPFAVGRGKTGFERPRGSVENL